MVKVQVNKADLAKVLAAIEKVKQTVLSQALLIPEESAREYTDLIRQNITLQKYGDFGQPRKSSWKNAYPATANLFWEWLGTVLSALAPSMLSKSAQSVAWRVGFTGPLGGSASGGGKTATPTKTKVATEQKQVWIVTGINRTTGKATKRLATAAEIKAMQKRKTANDFEKKISTGRTKGYTEHGKDSDLVKQLNKERGFSVAKEARETKTMPMGKAHETPREDRARRALIKRNQMTTEQQKEELLKRANDQIADRAAKKSK